VNTSIYRVGAEPAPDTDGRTKLGDSAPAFQLESLDGKPITEAELKGKVVLLTFFATWCGPCLAELPRVEREIWERFRSKSLIVLAVGREHTAEELLKFNEEHKFTFLLAADPERKVYSRFADKKIPRSYVLSAEGKIVYQSLGYSTPKFEQLVAAIEQELRKDRVAR
jgi:peroxiredoxin